MVWSLRAAQVKLLSVPAGSSEYTFNNVFSGILPSVVVLALVNAEALNGTVKSNPLHFGNFDVTDFDYRINGRSYRGQPMRPRFSAPKNYELYYHQLMETCAATGPVHYLDINHEQWEHQACLWVMETNTDASIRNTLPETGNIGVQFRFRAPTGTALTLIALGQKVETVSLHDTLDVQYYPITA